MDDPNADEDLLIPPDVRRPQRLLDSRIQNDDELSDSDDEGEGGRRNHSTNRDRDSVESGNGISTGRKYGIGSGIMHTGSAGTTHGAGPSGHVTRMFSTTSSGHGSSMEIETPPPLGDVEVKVENGREVSEQMDIDSSRAPTPTAIATETS